MPSIARNRNGARAETPARFTLAALAIVAAFAGHAFAGPVGEDVRHGQASFQRDGSHTRIDVHTDKAIINYDSFNLSREESVRFQQLSRSSRVLNRIRSASPTVIDGSLTANGQVYFVNPAGVMFGQNAVINTAGIYAAAGNVTNADFLNNVDRFTNLTGDVVNRGSINSQFVALVGKRVRNDGIIFADNGLVTMVAGDEVTLARRNDTVSVSFTRPEGAADDPSDVAAVTNNGAIDAGENGQATLAAGDMYWLGVKQSETGSVKAEQIAVNAEAGKAEISGALDARSADGRGGSVDIRADEIALYSAYVDASGATGGGWINVGGGQTIASHTLVDAGSVLRAEALAQGAGGVIEISGRAFEFAGADISTTGPAGTGWLILDPTDLEITTGAATLGTQVDPNSIITALGSNSVAVHTAGAGADDGTITITEFDSQVTLNTANTLAFLAQGDLVVNDSVTNAGAGDLVFVGGWDGSTGFTPSSPGAENGAINASAILTTPAAFGNTSGAATGLLTLAAAVGTGGDVAMAANNIDQTAGTISGTTFAFAAKSALGANGSEIATNITNLAGTNTGGGVFIDNAGSFSVVDDSGDSGITGLQSIAGAVELTASSGALTIDAAVDGDTVALTTTEGGAGSLTEDLAINAAVQATAGGVSLDAADDFSGTGSIAASNGLATLTFDSDGISSDGGVTDADFSNFSALPGTVNVTSGAANDRLILGAAFTGGSIDLGGVQTTGNELVGPDGGGANFTVTNSNQGTVGAITFQNVQALTGGNADDTFTFTNTGSIDHFLDGGNGNDTIVGDDSNDFIVEVPDGGRLPGKIDADNSAGATLDKFRNIENLTGGSGVDNFTLDSDLSGDIVGGGGNNTLILRFGDTLGGGYTGGANDDTVRFANGASVTGTVDFGAGGTNTLDYDTESFGAGVTVNRQAGAATNTGGVANLTDVVGDDGFNNTIVGLDAGETFTVSAEDTGNVAGTLNFTNFLDLTGGSGADTFNVNADLTGDIVGGGGNNTVNLAAGATLGGGYTGGANNDTLTLANGASVTGAVNFGAGGTNTLDYDANNFAGDIAVDLQAGTATSTGGVSNLTDLVGDAGQNNTLTGANAAQTWNITGTGAGNIGGTFNFTNIANLVGGGNDDTFSIADVSTVSAMSLTGSGDGGSGDALNVDDSRGTGIAYTVDDTQLDAAGGTNVLTLATIESVALTSGAGNDTITVTPSDTTAFNIDGGGQTGADTLTYDTAPLTASPDLQIATAASGTVAAIAPDTQLNVDYADIETIDVTGPHLLSPTFDLATVNGGFQDGTADTIDVQVSGGNITVNINGGLFNFTIAQSAVDELTVDGTNDDDTLNLDIGGGLFGATFNGNAGDDTLALNFANGLFDATFNGGAVAGFDTLAMQGDGGGGITDVTYNPVNVTDGSIDLDGNTVTYTGLAPIQDATTATNLVLHLTDAANTATITNGANAGSGVFTGVTNTGELQSPDVENYEWANKTNVTVNGGDATAGGDSADNITIDLPNQPGGPPFSQTGLAVNGDGGGDTITVAPHSNSIDPVLDGGGDSGDTFILNPDPAEPGVEIIVADNGPNLGSLDGRNSYTVTGVTTIDAGGFASAEVRGTNNNDTIRLAYVEGPPIVVVDGAGDLTAMTLLGRAGDDEFQIESMLVGSSTFSVDVQGQGGADTFRVARTSGGTLDTSIDLSNVMEGSLSFTGGIGADDLQIGDGANSPASAIVFNDRVENLTDQAINYANDIETMTLFLTGGQPKQVDIDNIGVNRLTVDSSGTTTDDQVTVDLDTLVDSAEVVVDFGGGADRLDVNGTAAGETYSFETDPTAVGADMRLRRNTAEELFLSGADFSDDTITLDALAGADTVDLAIPALPGGSGLARLDLTLGADADTINIINPVEATTFNLIAPTGQLEDQNDSGANGADVIATDLSLELDTGITDTSGDAFAGLETAVTNLDLRNISSGDVAIQNTGALTVTDNGVISGTRGNLGGGTTTINASSPLTVNMDQTFGGTTNLTATNSGAIDDDFTLDNATITLDGSGLTLNIDAGDDVRFINGGNIASAGAGGHTVNLTADTEAGGADADRGSVHQTGATTSVVADTLNIVAVGNDGDHGVGANVAVGDDATTPFRFDVNTLSSTLDGDAAPADGNQFLQAITTANTLTDITINAAAGFIDFTTDGTVNQTAGTLTANGLALRGAGTFTLAQATNDVTDFAADMTGSFSYTDDNAVDVDTVSGITGVAGASNGTINAHDGITLSADVTVTNTFTGNADADSDNIGAIAGAGNTITATTIDLDAATGIGGTRAGAVATNALTTSASTISADNTNVGNVEIVNELDTATSVTSLTTVGADILLEQIDSSGNPNTTSAGGALNIDGAVTSGDGGTNGGNVTLRSDGGGLNVNAPANIDTNIGSGGAIVITGGVDLDPAATISVGAGNVNLLGGQLDYIHDSAFTFNAPVTIDADRDILITALFATSGAGSDITLNADNDNDAVGGLRVSDPGEINSSAAIDINEAADLFATAATNDAIVIIADAGGDPQLVATSAVTLDTDTTANANAFMSIFGDIDSAFAGDAIVFGDAAAVRLRGTHTATDANGDIRVLSPLTLVGDGQFVGNDVTFEDTINDDGSVGTDSDLQVDADGVTAFQANVGGVTPIDSITTDAPGSTEVGTNGGGAIALSTSGSTQTYDDPFVLNNDTTLNDTGSGVFFNNTVDGDGNGPWDLTVNTAGTTQFGNDGADDVGATHALATLTTDAPGVTNINTDLIRTEGGVIDLLDDVTLGFVGITTIDATDGDAVSTGATITFGDTLDGTTARAQELTLDAGTGGDVNFDAAVGGGTRLGDLRIDRANNVSADAGVTVESLAFDAGDVSGNATFDSFINTDGATGSAAGNVTIDVDGNVTVVGAISAVGGTNPAGAGGTGGTVDIDGNTVAVDAINSSGGASTSGTDAGGNAGPIDIDAEGGAQTIAIDGDLTANGGSGSPTGDGADITLGIDTFATDTINFGAVDIAVTATGNNGGSIDFNAESVTGSNRGLTLNTGGPTDSGDITFDFGSDADGDDLSGFDDVIVTNAEIVSVSNGDNVNIGSFEQGNGSGATTFGGTLTTSDADGINITTASATFRDDVTANAGGDFALNTTGTVDFNAAEDGAAPVVLNGGGGMTVNNGGALTIVPGVGTVDLNGGGSFSQNGAGAVSTGADVSTESDGSVLFSSDVTLTASIEIDTDRGDPSDPVAGIDGSAGPFDTGGITFLGNILATASENLTLDAGAGEISVTGTVGNFDGAFGGADITDLLVVRANDTEFLSTVEVDTFTQAAGAGASPSTLLAESVNIHAVADSTGIQINNPGVLTLGNTADGNNELLTLINDADVLFSIGDAEFLGGANSIVPANAIASSDSILTIEPNDAGGNMTIGSGGAGGVALSNTDVNAIAEGYQVIFLGRADGNGTIDIGNAGLTFHDPLFVRAPETGGSGGSINLVGELTMDDTPADAATEAPLGFDAPSIELGGQIITNGQNLYFVHGLNQALTGGDPDAGAANLITQIGNPGGDTRDTNASVIVTDATDLNTSAPVASAAPAGEIYFEDTIDSETGEANDLTIAAAGDGAGVDGDLNFGSIAGQGGVTGRIGGNRRLGNLVINAARDTTFGHDAGGTVTALSFDQNAGSGDTTFNGRVTMNGVDVALQTGDFNNLDGGQVEIAITGDITFAGAILASGGPVVAGAGSDGGSVDLAGEDISVKRIDTRGSAGVTAAGGDAGVITLNATSDDGDDITLGGDLLATGGVVSGFADGDAAAINLGDTLAGEQVVLDPEALPQTGGWSMTDATVTIEGHDVTFDALVDANGADADAESLFVNTFLNNAAVTPAGTTTFNGLVGSVPGVNHQRPLAIRTDYSDDFATAADANGTTVIDTPTVNVVDELTFNDPLKIANDAGVTFDASGANGTIRFNNLLDSASGEANNLTLNAEHTIFDDDYAFNTGAATNEGVGTGVQDPDPTTNDAPDDAQVGSVDPLQILLTDTAGTTTINTTAIYVAAAEFNDAVVVATDGRTTLTATDGDTLLPAAPAPAAVETVRFDNTVDSSPSDADGNELVVTTTGGGTTIFNGRVGNTTPLGQLQTDTSASPDGVTQLNITTGAATDTDIETNGTSVEFNDPVELLTDTVIVENDPAGTVVFNNTVDGDGNGPWDLIVTTNGAAPGDVTTEFNGVVGGSDPLDLIRVNHLATNPGGDTTLLAANVFANAMEFVDNVVLGADVTLAADAALADAASVDFFALLDDDGTSPTNDLTVEATATQFHNAIGSLSPLGTVNTTPGGTTTLGDNADAITNIVSNAEQFLFDDAVVLEDDYTLNSSIAGDGSDTATLGIAFNDTLDSDATARDLTLNTTDGALTRFGDGTGTDEVGASSALDALTVDAGPAGDGTTLIDVDVYADTMVYNDAVAVGDDANDAADDATFDGVELGGTSAPTDATTVTFNNTVDTFSGDTNNNLFVFSTTTNVNGVVGGTGELGTLRTTDGGGDDTNLNTTAVNVQTAWFDDPVFIAIGTPGTPGTLTITASAEEADAAFEIADDAVQFNNTLDSQAGETNGLIVNTTAPNLGGVTRFGDDAGDSIGGTDRLSRIETNANGAVHVFAGNINTDGTTVIHNDPVVLFNNVIYNELTGNVVFNNTVDADAAANDRELRVQTTAGDAIFAGVVGGAEAPSLLETDNHVSASAAVGQTLIDTANVTVQSAMTFNEAVVIGVDSTLTATDPDGTVRFNNFLNSQASGAPLTNEFNNLTINAVTTVFDGNNAMGTGFNNAANDGQAATVGGTNPLGTLRTTLTGASDTTFINTPAMTASVLRFDDPVVAAIGTTLSGSAATPFDDVIIFNDTLSSFTGEFNNVTLNTAGDGDTLFRGNVGADVAGTAPATGTGATDGTELGNLVTNGDGRTLIDTPHVQTNGSQTYGNDVVLENDGGVTFREFNGSINFNELLDSDPDATEETATFFVQGNLNFNDVVGGTNRLGDVVVNDVNNLSALAAFTAASFTQGDDATDTTGGRGFSRFVGLVDTSALGGSGASGGDIVVLTHGDVRFYGGATLDGDGAGDGGMMLLRPDVDEFNGTNTDLAANVGGGTNNGPENILILRGEFTSRGGAGGGDGGMILLNADEADATRLGRSTNPTVATIRTTSPNGFLGDPPVADHNLLLEAGQVLIGPNEKLTAFGDVTLRNTDTSVTTTPRIIHNDLTILGNLTVNAGPNGDIFYRLRPAGQVLDVNGLLQSDLGVDVILGGLASYSETPQALAGTSGPPLIFANPGAIFTEPGPLQGFVQRDFTPVLEPLLRLGGGGIALDASSKGPSNANAAEALAAVAPKPEQSQQTLETTIVGEFQRQLLADFAGVDLTGLSQGQRLEFLAGRQLYKDLPAGPGGAKVAVARALMTENRLLYEPVSNMLDFYQRLFLERVIDPQTGQPTYISRHIEHRRDISDAFDGYTEQADTFGADRFVRFVSTNERHGDALQSLRGLRTLREKFQMLGLTPLENAQAMRSVIERVTPDGMTVDQVMAAVNRVEPMAADEVPGQAEDPDLDAEPESPEGEG